MEPRRIGTSASRSLDPAVLDRLSGLALVARTVVEGFMSGQHTSPHRGSSVEFAQHRPYVPGDEVRRIDWKIFARSDRLVIKEFVEESNLVCHLLVDKSESMGFGTLAWTKLDYARWCAASIAHLVLAQRDSAGLVLFDERERTTIPPASGAPQEGNVLGALEETEAGGGTGVGGVLGWLGTRLRRRSIAFVFSDFFDEPERIVAGVRRLVHGGHEPILFQILDPAELRFGFETLLRLEGLEDTGSLRVDPKAIRDAYLDEIRGHVDELKRHARALSVDFVQVDTQTGLDVALSTYLAHRLARARGRRG